jgi:hypothetical protein
MGAEKKPPLAICVTSRTKYDEISEIGFIQKKKCAASLNFQKPISKVAQACAGPPQLASQYLSASKCASNGVRSREACTADG